MSLSSDLLSQLVIATKEEKKTAKESTHLGTTVEYDGKIFVKLDGSDRLTPVSTTANTKPDERVTVLIKDHTATITGNMSSPSARTEDVEEIGKQISEFEIVIADKVSAKELEVERGRIDELVTDNVKIKEQLTAESAEIKQLKASDVEISGQLDANEASIKKLETDKLDANLAEIKYATVEGLNATNANINNLNASYAAFQKTTTDKLEANDASIKNLETEKLSAKDAEVKYANIDFSNIGKAAIEYFYATSGLIKDVVVGDGTITGELVGVTIKGDLIEGNTIKAEKLVVKGEDGLYYKLNVEAGATTSEEVTEDDLQNGLSGSVIIANTITAEKINVDDLVAFDATIGGFNITDSAIYSGVKESATNTTRGIYLDKEGQLSVGDSTNFLRYYKDSDGNYRLEISAASIHMSASDKNLEDYVDDKISGIQIGSRNLIRNSKNLIFENYRFRSYDDSGRSGALGTGVLGAMVLGEE
jgi:hypothetical protein